jgi:2',3'-cyclic-nucleotide 2'-phosphodiesterase/3'-nucleotidase/5'-nucleotidase
LSQADVRTAGFTAFNGATLDSSVRIYGRGTFIEDARVNAVALDPTAFPYGARLKNNAQLGRLTITNTRGDKDGDGDYDELYALGGRSFSILNEAGQMIFDSGDAIERAIANHPKFAAIFNASHTVNTLDDRSDAKGPEPESVTIR